MVPRFIVVTDYRIVDIIEVERVRFAAKYEQVVKNERV